MQNNNFEVIHQQIEKGGAIQPFLFVWSNLEILNSALNSYLLELLKTYDIDTQSLFQLSDTWDNLKIEEVKKTLEKWDIKSRFRFQVFFIENISRMTPQAQNACLKFFEEPGEWNIIIATNTSLSWILETIISRVRVIDSGMHVWMKKNEFYTSMIHSHVSSGSDELIRYFFSGKFEKTEYIEFLKNILLYILEKSVYSHLLDELQEDISGVLKNNLQGKYITDKYIMLLWS